MTLIFIADTVPHAKQAAKLLGGNHRTIACSPRSIAAGAARGLASVVGVVCDASAWPLDSKTLAEIVPTLIASPEKVTLVELNLSDPSDSVPA